MYHPSSGSGSCFTLKKIKIQQKKQRRQKREETKRKTILNLSDLSNSKHKRKMNENKVTHRGTILLPAPVLVLH
jgi:hypothetical protein